VARFIELVSEQGDCFQLTLDHWGAGRDPLSRRWIAAGKGWVCVETRETARSQGPGRSTGRFAAVKPLLLSARKLAQRL
jgi:hypothetical protein